MTRWGFALARLVGDEAAIARLSDGDAALAAEVAGLSVALVGNARSLAGAGAAIDAADLVVRLNAAPLPRAASHGTRTDWIATSVPLGAGLIAARAPRRVLWMPTALGRLSWAVAGRPGFVLRDARRNARLRAALGAPATTGLLAIDLLAAMPAGRVTLYGFDFFASLSLSGRRAAGDVPHNFAAERAHVEALLAADPRFRLWRQAGGAPVPA